MYVFNLKLIFYFGIFLFIFNYSISAETERTPPNVGLEEKLGQELPSNVKLRDEDGKKVFIEDFLKNNTKKPLILVPSYYTCPRLCNFLFKGLQEIIQKSFSNNMKLGRDYKMLSLSLLPENNSKIAKKKGEEVRAALAKQKVTAEDWNFWGGSETNVHKIMNSVGYHYHRDPHSSKDISHTAAIIIISPNGKIMRYLYGIKFSERDFRLALVEASNGRLGSTTEKILLFCFRYDSTQGKYTPFAWAFVRIGAGLTLCLILGFWLFLRGFGSKKRKQAYKPK